MKKLTGKPNKPFSDAGKGFTLLELLVTVVVMGVVLGIVGQILVQTQTVYLNQREMIRAQQDVRFALHTFVRLLRMSGNDPLETPIGFQAIDPDPDGNTIWDTIRIRADWNPADGDLADPDEDVRFTVNNNILLIQQASDASAVEFLPNISAIQFQYFDGDGNVIADPVTDNGAIARVQATVQGITATGATLQLSSQAVLRSKSR